VLEHDDTVGTLLKALDDMGIANNTIVVYSSDNGPHMNSWPDGAMTWFRSEKNTNWEGAFRVPCLVRWPGVVKPGTVTNELMSHNDWIPTLCSAAGEPDVVNKLKAGYTANGINYKVHLDGFDQTAFLRNVSGTAGNNNGTKSARDKFFYSDDDGLLVALRKGDYKYVYAEQRSPGRSRSRNCACRRYSTCCRTRSSEPTSRPTPSGTGSSTTLARSTARWTTSARS
jgi:arylsulfatase